MSTIDNNFHAAQIEFRREGALAKFDVASVGVIQATRPSDLIAGCSQIIG